MNRKCENSHDTITKDFDSTLDKVFGNLTNIVPLVGLNMGVLGEFGVDLGPFVKKVTDSLTIASTTFSLPTACLSYNSAEKTFGPPPVLTSTSASAKPTGGSSGEDKKSDAGIAHLGLGLARRNGLLVVLVFLITFHSLYILV